MAWNEPGGNDKDPWGGRNDQGPPDLDEVLRKLQDKFGGLFGGGKKAGGKSDSSGGGGGGVGLSLIAVVVVVLWSLSGFYTIEQAEQGVVLRFGEHVATTGPGLNWHIPMPVEHVEKVDISQVKTVHHKAHMLTQDENIVLIELAVQYRIRDGAEYLFNVNRPEATLKDATETAVREIVGQSKMDYILTDGRAQLVADAKKQIQHIVDDYQAGLLITKVNLQDAQPPEQVQAAFADAIKAREDEERLKNEAQAYAKRVVNNASGDAKRRLEEAEGYKAEVVAHAEGDAARFDSLLTEYNKAPRITRERLYLDAVESVLSKSSKIMLDVDGGNNLVYLPLDKLMGDRAVAGSQPQTMNLPTTGGQSVRTPRQPSPGRSVQRGREIR